MSDAEKRKIYDRSGEEGVNKMSGGGGHHDPFSSFFGDFFGGGGISVYLEKEETNAFRRT